MTQPNNPTEAVAEALVEMITLDPGPYRGEKLEMLMRDSRGFIAALKARGYDVVKQYDPN